MGKSRMRRHVLGYLFLLVVLALVYNATVTKATEEPAGSGRSRIGLTLGGGSAMGFTHIGVLKWLEENRIPVDYIAGTSMGGLIGGCYAMGMTPDEIAVFVKSINWDRVFQFVPPYEVLDFRRKEDHRDYPVEVEIGLRDKDIKLPGGLSVHEVGLLLSRLTFPYSTVENFDELPIPYRCVATDILNEEEVVMGDGSLAEAMRATMSIPGVFTPVERNGRLLVDGGVVNNVPADVVKQMGAEITIAVNLRAPVSKRDINGIDAVLMRTIGTVIANNARQSLNLAEIVLEPEMGVLKPTSWKAVDQFMALGYQTAAEQAGLLQKYSVDRETWREYLEKRRNRQKVKVPVPMGIEVVGTNEINERQIKELLKAYIGKPVDTTALEADLTGLTGTGLYESLRYKYILKDGIPVLSITAIEKPYGPPFVSFGLMADADGFYADHVDINGRFRITFLNPVGPGSELRTDLGLGTEIYSLVELYEPIGNSQLFIAPAWFSKQKNSSIYDDGTPITDYKTSEAGLTFDLGYTFNKIAEARLGYVLEYQKARVRVGDPFGSETDGEVRKARLKWNYSNADDAMLPRNGLTWNFEADWYYMAPGAGEPFGLAETKVIWNLPVGSRDSIFYLFSGGTSIGGNPPFLQKFRLGGPFHLGTFNMDEFYGNHYLLGDIGYLRYIGKLPITGKNLYCGVWLEHGGISNNWSDLKMDTDISIGLISPTIFGLIYVGGNLGKGDNPFFNIMVGKVF